MDVPLMILFNSLYGIDRIDWTAPITDQLALVIALLLFVPYLKTISGNEV